MALNQNSLSNQDAPDIPADMISARRGWLEWFWPTALFLAVVLTRGFAIYCDREINVDESLMIEQVMRYQHDPVPWRSVDGLTSGPINTWALSLAHFFAMPLTYRGVHLFAAGLLGIIVSGGFVLARRSHGFSAAILATATAVVWLAVNQAADFTHYSSELVPIALLTFSLLLIDVRPCPNGRFQLILVALGGVAIGLMPWAKLQSAPIALAVGLWFTGASFWIYKRERPWALGLALAAGAILPTVAILSLILWGGAGEVFWRSYIISNLGYAGQKTWWQMIQDSLKLLFSGAIGPWVIIVLSAWFVVCFRRFRVRGTQINMLNPETGLAWLLLISAGFVCVRPSTQFEHYSLFLLLPLILATAALGPACRLLSPSSVGSSRRAFRNCFIICAVAWLSYGAFHARLTREQLFELYRERARNDDAAAVIAKIRSVDPQFHRVEVWGWFPSIYVQLQQPASTRDGIPHMLYTPGPSREFLRKIYFHDLHQAKPDVILKMCGAVDRQWTTDANFFPELADYISKNYDRRWSGVTPFYHKQASLEIYVLREKLR